MLLFFLIENRTPICFGISLLYVLRQPTKFVSCSPIVELQMVTDSWTVTDRTHLKWLMLKANPSTASSTLRYTSTWESICYNWSLNHFIRRRNKVSVILMPAKPIYLLRMIQTTLPVIFTTRLSRKNSLPGPLKFKWWLSNKLKNSAGIHLIWQRFLKMILTTRRYWTNYVYVAI